MLGSNKFGGKGAAAPGLRGYVPGFSFKAFLGVVFGFYVRKPQPYMLKILFAVT